MKHLKKTLLSLLLASSIVCSSVPAQAASVDIAEYNSLYFYDRCTPELRSLQKDADTVSIVGYCEEEGAVDSAVLHIWSDDFALDIPFTIDGNVKTYAYSIPAGIHKMNCTSANSSLRKRVYAVFTVNE